MESNRVKTQSNHSSNHIKTILPSIRNSNSQTQVALPSNLTGAEDIKKLYFKKAVKRRRDQGKKSQLPPGVSSKQLMKITHLERETRWDSRFVNDRIPEIYPKFRDTSVDIKAKKPEKGLETKLYLATSRSGQHDLRDHPEDEQPYYTRRIEIQDRTRQVATPEKDFVSNAKDSDTVVKQVNTLSRGLMQKRDNVYRLENQYLDKKIPEFQKNIIRKMFDELKSREGQVLPRFIVREFREFFESIESAMTATNQREEALLDLMMTLKERIQKPQEKLLSVQQQIQPLLIQISILTMNCIEAIVRWGQRLRDLIKKYKIVSLPQQVVYQHKQGENYIKKILTDTQFFFQTKLYPEAYFPDPFFISYNLDKIYLDRDMVYRARASELFILEQHLLI